MMRADRQWRGWQPPGQGNVVYTCIDGSEVTCRRDIIQIIEVDQNHAFAAPRSGIRLKRGQSRAVIAENVADRTVTEVIRGSGTRTCTFPLTVRTVRLGAFIDRQNLRSVRLNEGLSALGEQCFCNSGIRRLVLSSSVSEIGDEAFAQCRFLQRADLRKARGLRELGQAAFCSCRTLRRVLLGDSLEAVSQGCFSECGIEEVTIPENVTCIGNGAFHSCKQLKRVSFAGSALESIGPKGFAKSGLECFTAPPSLREIREYAFVGCNSLKHADLSACLSSDQQVNSFLSKGAFKNTVLESVKLPRTLRAIGERVFFGCKCLKHVILDTNALLEEIGFKAFYGAGLREFAAPASLRKIGDLVFGECRKLKKLTLNTGIQELGWLCLWATAVADLKPPQNVTMTPEQLGVGQSDPRKLRLPHGLEAVGDHWFEESGIEQLTIPSCVKELGERAFCGCEQLREVVFERDSRLESIGDSCFINCRLASVVIPKSVRDIRGGAFYGCQSLSELSFEEGSQLSHVGVYAFDGTLLTSEHLRYPNAVEEDKSEDDWL